MVLSMKLKIVASSNCGPFEGCLEVCRFTFDVILEASRLERSSSLCSLRRSEMCLSVETSCFCIDRWRRVDVRR